MPAYPGGALEYLKSANHHMMGEGDAQQLSPLGVIQRRYADKDRRGLPGTQREREQDADVFVVGCGGRHDLPM
jgi:hypothetical protein